MERTSTCAPSPRCLVVDQNVDLLDAREMADDLRIDPRNRLELARPVGAIVRPRDPRGLVRLPLGRHAIAERGGSLGVSMSSMISS